jgi:hypothetical protein
MDAQDVVPGHPDSLIDIDHEALNSLTGLLAAHHQLTVHPDVPVAILALPTYREHGKSVASASFEGREQFGKARSQLVIAAHVEGESSGFALDQDRGSVVHGSHRKACTLRA